MGLAAPEFVELIGSVIHDRYRVDRLLGSGGMGVVVAAHDLRLKRDVAIKLILPGETVEPEVAKRFMLEARVTANLRHRNIVLVYHADQDPDGRVYLVQELLEGRSLRQELDIDLYMPPDIAVPRLLSVADALARAHREGIVHRDVKPANIFLAHEHEGDEQGPSTERVVVLDFGVCKELRPEHRRSGVTRKGDAIGTAEYMSPEQIEERTDIDARTDVWALGMVAYEMVTGDKPWTVTTLAGLTHAITTRPVPDPREVSPWHLSDDFAAVILKALERDRSKRYADAGELSKALRAITRTGLGTQRTPRRPPTEAERSRGLRAADALRRVGSSRVPRARRPRWTRECPASRC